MPNQHTSYILQNVLEATVQTQIAVALLQANYQNVSSFLFYHGVVEAGYICCLSAFG